MLVASFVAYGQRYYAIDPLRRVANLPFLGMLGSLVALVAFSLADSANRAWALPVFGVAALLLAAGAIWLIARPARPKN